MPPLLHPNSFFRNWSICVLSSLYSHTLLHIPCCVHFLTSHSLLNQYVTSDSKDFPLTCVSPLSAVSISINGTTIYPSTWTRNLNDFNSFPPPPTSNLLMYLVGPISKLYPKPIYFPLFPLLSLKTSPEQPLVWVIPCFLSCPQAYNPFFSQLQSKLKKKKKNLISFRVPNPQQSSTHHTDLLRFTSQIIPSPAPEPLHSPDIFDGQFVHLLQFSTITISVRHCLTIPGVSCFSLRKPLVFF